MTVSRWDLATVVATALLAGVGGGVMAQEPGPETPPAAEEKAPAAAAEKAPVREKPSADARPVDAKPAEARPADGTPADAAPAEKPADEKPAAPAAPLSPEGVKAKEAFDAKFARFRERIVRLEEIHSKYRAAERTQIADLRKQWDEEIAAGQKELPALREVTIAAWEAGVEREGEVGMLLADMLVDDVRTDRYEEAYSLAEKVLAVPALAEKVLAVPALAENGDLLAAGGIAAAVTNHFAEAESWLAKAMTKKPADEKLTEQATQYLGVTKGEKYADAWAAEQKVREAEAKADDLPRVRIETTAGPIVVELYENEAPETVGNFVSLVKKGFYDKTPFHRVLPGFMAQGGDPEGTGTGGPGYTIKDEHEKPNARKHFRGVLSMANTGDPNTGGSQFFLTFVPTSFLNGRHTVFGRVIEGMDVLAKLKRIDPEQPKAIEPDRIVKATVVRDRGHAYEPTKAGTRETPRP